MIEETLTLQFDGGSRGNPGPAGVGVVLLSQDGGEIFTLGKFIGRATNNVAEYKGLITGLEEAKKLGATKLLVRGDSELIIKQMRGEYRVKNPDLRVLYDKAFDLVAQFEQVKFEHNLRHKNATADGLANLAMDRRADVTDVDGASLKPKKPAKAADENAHGCPQCGVEIQVKKPGTSEGGDFTCRCGTPMRSLAGEN